MTQVHNSLLIADDNEMNREVLCRRLEKQGYTVAVASDGQEALSMMEVEDFDLLLLDIMMPIMDGYAVLETMQANVKLQSIPVIVLTAESDASNVIRCIELGASDYLVKPFDMVALRNRIVRCLLNRRAREDVKGNLDWSGNDQPNVLVVEDDEMSRELLQKRVERAGYHVDAVSGGQAALDKLRQTSSIKYDLVLLDIMMPDMNGFEVLAQLKQDDQLKHISVIMISALDDQESMERCLREGAEDYITKPFNALVLRARILSCLQSKRLRDRDREQVAG